MNVIGDSVNEKKKQYELFKKNPIKNLPTNYCKHRRDCKEQFDLGLYCLPFRLAPFKTHTATVFHFKGMYHFRCPKFGNTYGPLLSKLHEHWGRVASSHNTGCGLPSL